MKTTMPSKAKPKSPGDNPGPFPGAPRLGQAEFIGTTDGGIPKFNITPPARPGFHWYARGSKMQWARHGINLYRLNAVYLDQGRAVFFRKKTF